MARRMMLEETGPCLRDDEMPEPVQVLCMFLVLFFRVFSVSCA